LVILRRFVFVRQNLVILGQPNAVSASIFDPIAPEGQQIRGPVSSAPVNTVAPEVNELDLSSLTV
jgi:hypothetical protein